MAAALGTTVLVLLPWVRVNKSIVIWLWQTSKYNARRKNKLYRIEHIQLFASLHKLYVTVAESTKVFTVCYIYNGTFKLCKGFGTFQKCLWCWKRLMYYKSYNILIQKKYVWEFWSSIRVRKLNKDAMKHDWQISQASLLQIHIVQGIITAISHKKCIFSFFTLNTTPVNLCKRYTKYKCHQDCIFQTF